MNEITASVVWGVFVIVLVINHIWQVRGWNKERAQLLNRIMSRDYEQYANINIKTMEAGVPVEVVKMEDLEQRITESAAGIPV